MARTGFGRKGVNGTATAVPNRMPAEVPAANAMRSSAPLNTTAARDTKPTVEQIRQRAYELYHARTKTGHAGDSTADWLEAERQLRAVSPHSAR